MFLQATPAAHEFKGITNDIQLVQRKPSEGSSTVPKVVWTLWLGKPMQGARLEAFKDIEASVGVPVRLVQVRSCLSTTIGCTVDKSQPFKAYLSVVRSCET